MYKNNKKLFDLKKSSMLKNTFYFKNHFFSNKLTIFY